jgi:hypothetical protein
MEVSRHWEGNILEFEEHLKAKVEVDFEGIWDLDSNYTICIIQEDDILTGFVIESIYTDWLPNMVKFVTKQYGDNIKTTWFMRDHSINVFYHEPVLLGNNIIVVGNSTLHRLYPSFPDVGIDFSKDATYLVDMIEKAHPIFILEGMLSEGYDEMRVDYLSTTSEPISVMEFYLATMRYFVALRDGHMNLFFHIDLGRGIDIPFSYNNGRLSLAESGDMEITKIGGVDVSDIFYQIQRHVYFENASMRSLYLSTFSRFEMIFNLAGAETIEGDRVQITLNQNGKTSTTVVDLEDNIPIFYRPERDYIIRHEMIGDIFYISLARFDDSAHITEVVDEIKKAIKNGTWRFIVDVRGNPGGRSIVKYRLIEAMEIKIQTPSWVCRLSELVMQQRFDNISIKQLKRRSLLMTPIRWLFNGGVVVNDTLVRQSSTKSRNRNNVFVSVLTDRYTASAATATGVAIQDGRFGNVIGEPSRNAPNHFGDVIHFHLPISQIMMMVSTSYFMRPDLNADPHVLHPDILVPADMALEKAIQVLSDL